MSPNPRPILKRLLSSDKQSDHPTQQQPTLPFATCTRIMSPHVHFPPTPSIVVSTHSVHSPHTYDRKPIAVSPNYHVLPQLGPRKMYSPPVDFEVEKPAERGRGQKPSDKFKLEHIKGSYFHPRAYEACEPEPLLVDDSQLSPPLIQGSSSTLARKSYLTKASDLYDSEDDADDESVTTPPDTKLPATSVVIVDPPGSAPLRPSLVGFGDLGNAECVPVEGMDRPTTLVVRSSKSPSSTQLKSSSKERVFSTVFHDEGCLGGF